MRKAGIIIFAIGLFVTLVTGFNFVKEEKIVDIGYVENSADMNHSLEWSPITGVVVMAIGGVVVLVVGKER